MVMFSVMSRRKLALRAAAELGDSGGTSRVLTWPGRGALAITAIAQPPSCGAAPPITSRLNNCSRALKMFETCPSQRITAQARLGPDDRRAGGQGASDICDRSPRSVDH